LPTITLRGGDFGTGETIRFDSGGLFVPDPARKGATIYLPFTAIEEVEALSDDHSARLKEAGSRAFEGFRKFGPAGLAMGVFAVTKVKDVVFGVQLNDGRGFTAITDAATFAEVHTAHIRGRAEALGPELGRHPADEMIARYVEAAKAAPAAAATPPAVSPAPQPAAVPAKQAPAAGARPPAPARPVFGRRGR
jgi:hypothetical protein